MMSTAKVGCHARLREKMIPTYTSIFGPIEADELFVIHHIDMGAGRKTIYLRRNSEPDRVISAWAGHVSPLPRCEICDQEGHTKSRCKKTESRTT